MDYGQIHHLYSEKQLLFRELSDLFAVDDNHRISRDLLTRVGLLMEYVTHMKFEPPFC